jgi:hypothetical protein
LVLSKFNDSKFKLNYLFNCSNTALMSHWKSTIFELEITTLVPSAKRISTEFPIKISGKSLIYTRNNKSLRIDPCGTPCFIFISRWRDVGSMKCIYVYGCMYVCGFFCQFHKPLMSNFIHSFRNLIKFCKFHLNSMFCYVNISAKCFLLEITLLPGLE